MKLEKALTVLPKRKLLSDSFCFYLLFLRCFFTSLEMDADNTKTKGLKKKKWKHMYIFGIFARVKYLVLCILLLGKLFLFALLNFWRKWRIYLYSSQKGFYQNFKVLIRSLSNGVCNVNEKSTVASHKHPPSHWVKNVDNISKKCRFQRVKPQSSRLLYKKVRLVLELKNQKISLHCRLQNSAMISLNSLHWQIFQ